MDPTEHESKPPSFRKEEDYSRAHAAIESLSASIFRVHHPAHDPTYVVSKLRRNLRRRQFWYVKVYAPRLQKWYQAHFAEYKLEHCRKVVLALGILDEYLIKHYYGKKPKWRCSECEDWDCMGSCRLTALKAKLVLREAAETDGKTRGGMESAPRRWRNCRGILMHRWNREEDELLLDVKARGMKWDEIAREHFPLLTPNACCKRYAALMAMRSTDG